MSARNTTHGYGWVARGLHWLVALTVFGMFALGWWMRGLDYYHPWYQPAPDLHISIGFLLLGVVVLRLIWRIMNPSPAPLSANPLEIRLAALAHTALYIVLILLMLTGYLYATSEGRPTDIFGIVHVPALPGTKSLKGIIGYVHEYLAYGIMALAAAHAGAALKHHLIDRDDTLRRMIRDRTGITD